MRRRSTDRQFWLASGLVHLLLFALVLAVPVREVIFEREVLKPEVMRQGEELAEVIDDVRDLAVDRLLAQVDLLAAGRERMADNFDTLNTFHQPFVAMQRSTARRRTEDQIGVLLEQQEALLAAIERAVAHGAGGSDPMWRVYDKGRARIAVGQEELSRSILLIVGPGSDMLERHRAAEQAQLTANGLVQRSVSAQNLLWRNAKTVSTADEQIPQMMEKLEEWKQRQAELEAQIAAAQPLVDGDDKAAAAKARKQIADAQARLKRLRSYADKDAAKLARLQAGRQQAIDAKPGLIAKRDDAARAAGVAQQEALALTRGVYADLVQAMDERDAAEAAAAANQVPPVETSAP